MTGNRWCAALAPSHAPGKGVLARGRQSQRGARSRVRVQRPGGSTLPRRIGPHLSARLSSDNRRAGRKAVVVDTNRNPKADTFADPLKADIFAELRQPPKLPLTEPICSVTVST
jgi:hypothetical protein